MTDQHRDKPLSLRFEGKPYWPPIKRELGLDATGAAIVLDICHADGPVSYSLSSDHYTKPRRYRNELYTLARVRRAVEHLDDLGLIINRKQIPGWRGWQSTMQATPELIDLCREITGGERPRLARLRESILLRDDEGQLIDYRDTQTLHRQRRFLERFNEALRGGGIDPAFLAPVARIFNVTFKRGGRFYAMGASWQNMKRDARKAITISGEPVAELDFKTLHPAILYAEAGAAMPADCYHIEGWPRSLVKVALLILINADNYQKAVHAIAHHEKIAAVASPGTEESKVKARQLIGALKLMHKPISRSFHSGRGAELMAIDSTMAEAVMNAMLMQGVIVLPLHDSFLVQASKRDELEAAMHDAAHKLGLFGMQIEAK